jgi:hypothetical protein
MPAYFPEGDDATPMDSELRSLHKLCSLLFIANGDMGPSFYPEGSEPMPGDDEERLYIKINALRS